ncbi:transcription initiation protein [Heliobacterium undosum]|uniref:Transcription initiation protein n=2 Tax=Heliomicrobium undosum TaxID=121734 RepID=A0A845L708_9FIRM|nr:transcription initiation protein [Heliomicrobium undosum]
MDKFLLLFRMDITEEAQPTPAQMEIYMQQWESWISGIAKEDRLAGGNHLSNEGTVLRRNDVVQDGPYRADKESIAGYIIIKAMNFEEAVNIAKGCPILLGEGTSVEVRKIASR